MKQFTYQFEIKRRTKTARAFFAIVRREYHKKTGRDIIPRWVRSFEDWSNPQEPREVYNPGAWEIVQPANLELYHGDRNGGTDCVISWKDGGGYAYIAKYRVIKDPSAEAAGKEARS